MFWHIFHNNLTAFLQSLHFSHHLTLFKFFTILIFSCNIYTVSITNFVYILKVCFYSTRKTRTFINLVVSIDFNKWKYIKSYYLFFSTVLGNIKWLSYSNALLAATGIKVFSLYRKLNTEWAALWHFLA